MFYLLSNTLYLAVHRRQLSMTDMKQEHFLGKKMIATQCFFVLSKYWCERFHCDSLVILQETVPN